MAAPTKPPQHFQYFFIMIALLGVFLFQDYMSGFGEKAQTLPYSQFQDMLHTGKLDNLVVSANRIDGSIKSPEKKVSRRNSARSGLIQPWPKRYPPIT